MSKICMNEACQAATTLEWKKGWGLKSGGFATLCYYCGSAYENLVYCETFHLGESGWRECRLCGKHIHCGCIASKYLHDYLDFGGVGCISCAKSLESCSIRLPQIINDDIPSEYGPLTANSIGDEQSVKNRMGGISLDKGKLVKLSKNMEAKVLSRSGTNPSVGKIKRGEFMHPIGEVDSGFPDPMQQSVEPSISARPENRRPKVGAKDMYESTSRPSLSFSLSTALDTSNSILPSPGGAVEGREQSKVSSFQQRQRTCHIFPKPPKTDLTTGAEANKGVVSLTRVARPPADGRGRNQLLPRYWPRISDHELQQISGDLNSTIVPLFEKVLSASDAGRIGRLVLPKACAEAYFPPISQSEGLPIRIQDIKGKEWIFQFRFWPNNNSRMYVLEGVTPCIQNMQLQAGDTVIFSRIDPGGKLVMGFRKASNPVDMQETQSSALLKCTSSGETSLSGVNDNMPTNGGRTNEDLSERPMLTSEKKRSRNIGSKSKRLLMRSEDAMELRITWDESQELLRPPPNAKPTIFMIEDQEVEEYNEPPVIGKRTIFSAQPSGEQEQWAQCDSCSKWRRLPVDVLLPPKWTCSDNIWNSSRYSCSSPGEMNPKELESRLLVKKDFKKRRITESSKAAQESEPSGLVTLATAAVLGDDAGDDLDELSVGPTTRHPRHRPGCSCIVCIQPPSGKGKHKSSCTCNVCTTVKRRFKTLMLRKKKRQSEREAENSQGKEQISTRDEPEMDGGSSGRVVAERNPSQDEGNQNGIPKDVAETSKEQLDLNCHPNRDEEAGAEATSLSITSLVNAASLPLEMYLRQNSLTNLGPSLLSQAPAEAEAEGCPSVAEGAQEH